MLNAGLFQKILQNMKLNKYTPIFILAISTILFAACSKMDDYKEFGAGKEKLYSGKPDSAITFSGKNRIKLSWLRASDPKVVKTRIFWNNHTDSVEVVQPNNTDKRLTTIISLPEGNYNFELYNYDAAGNRSVASRVSGSSFGPIYQQSLLNRGLESFYARQFNIENKAALSWYPSDSKSPGMEVTYKNTGGQNVTVISDGKAGSTFLADYDLSSPVTYRTMFLPDSSAIDVFYAPSLTVSPSSLVANQIHLKNAGYPFKASKTVGRWGTLADWITNDAAKNHDGPVGGLDNLNTSVENYISFEYWGTPAITNGKIYQVGKLAPGSYRLVVTISSATNNLEDSYICVTKGNIVPDIADVNSSLANLKVINSSMSNKDFTLAFTLTQQEVIALGMSVTMKTVNESSLRIRKFTLFKDI